ncbi:PIN domain-containing protein [Oribacterium sp. FC2011]|uniref:PIN domain-containing protein n=1 Tax=Oribacterium sp. FC2011 TaxID=1408311 RepID=UPI00067939DD|nr:PIN domain-containing protein [Oribacterium sp. FC2011]
MIILVDFENTHVSGLEGYEYLDDNDTLVMYYSDENSAVTKGMVNDLKKKNVHVSLVKLLKQHSNALDMYIASTTGMFLESGEKICIVSKDKGYAAVRDFWHSLRGAEILLGETIKECLLSSEKNDDERIRLCKERSQKTNLVDAFATMNTIPTRPTLSKANRRRRGQNINFTEVTEPASLIPNPLMMETPADQLAKQMKDQTAESAAESKSSKNKDFGDNSKKDSSRESSKESTRESNRKDRSRSEKASKDSEKANTKGSSAKADTSNHDDNLKKEEPQEKPKALIKSAPEKTAIIPRPEQRTALVKTEPKFDPNRVQFVYDPASRSMKKVESIFDKQEKETEEKATDVKADTQASDKDSSIPNAEITKENDTPVIAAATAESATAEMKSDNSDEEKAKVELTNDAEKGVAASEVTTEETTSPVQAEDALKQEKKSSKKSSSAKNKKSENQKPGRKTNKKTEAKSTVKSESKSDETSKDSGESTDQTASASKSTTEKKEKKQTGKNTKKTAGKSKSTKGKTKETLDSSKVSDKEEDSTRKSAEDTDNSSRSKSTSSKKESKAKANDEQQVAPDMEALQTEAMTRYGLTANTLHTYYVRLMKAYGREQGRALYDVSKKAVQEDIKKRKASNS